MKVSGLRGSVVLASLVALLIGGCGGASSSQTASSASPTPKAPATTVKTATKSVAGKSETILVDGKGMTLYYFTPDKGGTVACTGACLQNWPPLLLPSGTASPTGDSGVTGKLATVSNPEGTQVSYNGWPLYYYVKDKDTEDTYGQNVGGKWFVVTPDLASATA
jgi:predicted lipoprotein with Yx(FWY)xxD motif